MAYRTLEITFISAKDLPDVNLFSKMDVYVVASIDGDSRSTQRTPTDQDGGKSPSWNSVHRFSIPADPNFASNLVLHVVLRSERALGDRDVGDLRIPLKELVNDDGANSGKPQFVSYQVHKAGSGKSKGVLNISYKFLEPPVTAPVPPAPAGYPVEGTDSKHHESKNEAPVPAYPAPATASASAYPPPGAAPYAAPPNYGAPPPGYGAPPPVYGAPPPGYPQQPYGYGAPPAPGYGYPPQQYQQPGYGYGAPPPVVQPAKQKKNKFGLGLGAGIGAGLLGGLIVGDMVGDAMEDSYDAGFDDGGGFDF